MTSALLLALLVAALVAGGMAAILDLAVEAYYWRRET